MKCHLNVFFFFFLLTLAISLKYSASKPAPGNLTSSQFEQSKPGNENFNNQLYNTIVRNIKQGDYGDISSLIVLSGNKIIGEHYFKNGHRNQLHSIQSISKSITSLLIGKAIDLKYINSVDENIHPFFSEYNLKENEFKMQPLKLKHLLTMSAGLKWSEQYPFSDDRNSFKKLLQSNQNYLEYLFNQPLATQPGNKFEYNSALTLTLGSILQRASKTEVEDFANQYLFSPLKMQYKWKNTVHDKADTNGLINCAGGLYLRSIDMAKIGYLVKNKGVWMGKELISKK